MAIHRRLNEPWYVSVASVASKALSTARSSQTTSNGTISVDNGDGTRTVIGSANGTDSTGTSYGVSQWVGDTTPPSAPTGLTWRSSMGDVSAEWDGTLEDGVPADFAYVALRADGVEFEWLFGAGSGQCLTDVEAGGTVSCDAVAYDEAGNVSEASEEALLTIVDTAAEISEAVAANKEAIEEEVSALAQTVADIEDSVTEAAETAQETANLALSEAALAQTDATNAKTEAANASSSVTTLASTVDGISDLIRATDDGLEVARIVEGDDGEEYMTTRTLMTGAGFLVYQQDGETPVAAMGDGFIVYDGDGNLAGSFTESGLDLYTGLDADGLAHQTAAFTDEGLSLYALGDEGYSEQVAALTGSGVTFYQDALRRLQLTSSGLHVYDGSSSNKSKLFIGSGSARIGTTSGARMYLDTSGLSLYSEAGEKAAAFTSDGVALYENSLKSAAFTDSGVSFYDSEGDEDDPTAFFGDESFSIGEEGGERIEGTGSGINLYNSYGNKGMTMTSSLLRIYQPSSSSKTGGVSITSSGLTIYRPSSTTSGVYVGSSTVRIGDTSTSGGGYMTITSSGLRVLDSDGNRQLLIDGSDVTLGRSGTAYDKVFIAEDSLGMYAKTAPDDGYPFWIGTDYSDVGPDNTYFRVSSEGDVGVGNGIYINGDLHFQGGTAGEDAARSTLAVSVKAVTATFGAVSSGTTYTHSSDSVSIDDDEPDEGYQFLGVVGWNGATILAKGRLTRVYAFGENFYFSFRCDTDYSTSGKTVVFYVLEGAEGFMTSVEV